MTFDEYPIVPLPGSGGWETAHKWGEEMEKIFPGQDASDLAYAIEYNDAGPLRDNNIVSLYLEQHGANDERAWIWHVTLDDNTCWVVTGSCDYTGWDCQSTLDWQQK